MIDEMTEAERDARHAEKMRKKKAARDKIIATKTIEKGLLIVHTGKHYCRPRDPRCDSCPLRAFLPGGTPA